MGNVAKYFFIDVQFPPTFIDKKVEEHLTVKLNHGLNMECKVRSSPEATLRWSFVSFFNKYVRDNTRLTFALSQNLTRISNNANDFYFSSNNDILRINNANKNHEGEKYFKRLS